ncbi:protein TonB-like [Zingiber officinale]|uniref:protein TonB-like n=1 Tax=Zingiber officinale TaxID=94328 RepID=UPI001C4BBB77|nr:protein TonB-like [Zingiber officinale]
MVNGTSSARLPRHCYLSHRGVLAFPSFSGSAAAFRYLLRRDMASSSWCLSTASPTCVPSMLPSRRPKQSPGAAAGLGAPSPMRRAHGVVCMAPQEERKTRRSPLDFPIEWERPKPPRRPDIFPQFSPMKTPLPHPLPEDPPEEDEEEEEEQQQQEEEEEKPDEEDPEKPEQSRMQHEWWF